MHGTIKNQKSSLADTVERHLRDYFAAHEDDLPASGLYDRVLQEVERPLLSLALHECKGNQLRAAELLGLNRNTLRKKIRELGLNLDRQKKRGVANDR
jgi:two-component system nitrogen regulation response regulator GlnG